MALVLVLAVFILVGYAASLWWLLRDEDATTVWQVVVLCCLGLALHTAAADKYPPGVNEDEARSLSLAYKSMMAGEPLAVGLEGPLFLCTLFQAPLVPLIGGDRWPIRMYPIAAGVLAIAAAFAAARSLNLSRAPALAFAVFAATLPWAQFYGRITWGGELTFHQLLAIAATARLVFGTGGWPEVAIGALGVSLCLYGYPGGWLVGGMPVLAFVLATGRRRWLALAMLGAAALAIAPYYILTMRHWIDEVLVKVPTGYSSDPLATVQVKIVSTLTALVLPRAREGWMAIRSAGVHPIWFLLLAIVGSFTGVRRALYLWGGFCGMMVTSVLSEGELPSTHRMLVMFPFISLAVAAAIDTLPGRFKNAAAVVAAIVVTIGGTQQFFAKEFWPPESTWMFEPEKTRAVEALRPSSVALPIVSPDVGTYYQMREMIDPFEPLLASNWYPGNNQLYSYAFGPQSAALQPFYVELFGPERVETYGRAFVVRVDWADWNWMRQRGWQHEVRCGHVAMTAQIPTLFRLAEQFQGIFCPGPGESVWRGTWLGPATLLRFRFSGTVRIDTPRGRAERTAVRDGEAWMDFAVETGDDITISTLAPVNHPAGLFIVTPAGDRIPSWEMVAPAEPMSIDTERWGKQRFDFGPLVATTSPEAAQAQ